MKFDLKHTFMQENASENVVCKMSAISLSPQWVIKKTNIDMGSGSRRYGI